MQALWMVVASFFFATMGVGVKFASAQFNVYEIVFYRGLIGIVFMALVMRQRRISVMTTVPWMHVWRSVIGVFSLLCWFYAIANLPLATAMTLNYMSGVWVAAFVVGSAVFYSFGDASKSQGALVMTVLCGFAGVVLTLRPTIEQNQLFAGVLGLLSGIAAALAYMQVALLAKAGEPEERTVLYFGMGSAIAGAIGMAIHGVSEASSWHTSAAWWLLPIGIFATLGQWGMTRAYSKGGTLVVASLQYSGIVFASIYSVILFDDAISPVGWLGIVVIVLSGLAATALRARAAVPLKQADEH